MSKVVITMKHKNCDDDCIDYSGCEIEIDTQEVEEMITEFNKFGEMIRNRFHKATEEEIHLWMNQNWRNYIIDFEPKTIMFIKDIKKKFNLGLKDAKDYVDNHREFGAFLNAWREFERQKNYINF